MYAELLRAQERVLGPEHRDTLNTAMQLAGASLNQGRNAEAESQYRQVLALRVRVRVWGRGRGRGRSSL